MSTHLEQAETDAIREIAQQADGPTVGEVALRDFHQPRRLSAGRLRRISKTIEASFQEIAGRLRPLVRENTRFKLCSVTEVNAADIVDTLDTQFLMQCFRCAGELGWLVWDSAFAAAAAEAILTGTFEGEVQPRKLSCAELCIIGQLLNEIVIPVARRFDFTFEALQTVQDRADLAELTPAPDRVEPRVHVHLQFEGIGGTSDLSLYLGGFSPDPTSATEAHALPEHLVDVALPLNAYLGSIDLPLTDLLGLEVGDVIPLGLDAASPIRLYVEDRACATADLGRVGKTLAVRVRGLDPGSADIEEPSEL